MSRNVYKATAAVFFLMMSAGVRAAQMQGVESHRALKVTKGVYAIYQLGKRIGREEFKKTIFDDNEMLLESRTVFAFAGKDSSVEERSMLLEEDSYFPKKYHFKKDAGKFHNETYAEMYANVALIKMISNGKERSSTLVISNGDVFVDSGVANQLQILLMRYNKKVGGKQSIMVFEPSIRKESAVVLEYMGKESTEVGDTSRELDYYRIQKEHGVEIKLYVDDARNLVKVDDTLQQMKFILTSIEESSG